MVKALSGLKSSIEDLERSHENLRENGETWLQMAGQITTGVEVLRSQVGKLTGALTSSVQESEELNQAAERPKEDAVSTAPLALASSAHEVNAEPPLAFRA